MRASRTARFTCSTAALWKRARAAPATKADGQAGRKRLPTSMETLLNDLRHGSRTLLRNPGFTAVALLSLALGIGANTAIFSFINTVLLKSLPVKDPKSLVLFGTGKGRGNNGGPADGPMELYSWMEYQDLHARNNVLRDLLAVDSSTERIYAAFAEGTPEGVAS